MILKRMVSRGSLMNMQYGLLATLLMFSCINEKRKELSFDKVQSLKEFEIIIEKNGLYIKNEKQSVIKLYTNLKNVSIKKAFLGLETNKVQEIDKDFNVVNELSPQICMNTDTVEYWFRPTKSGEFNFENLLLVLEKDGKVYVGDTTFTFIVKDER